MKIVECTMYKDSRGVPHSTLEDAKNAEAKDQLHLLCCKALGDEPNHDYGGRCPFTIYSYTLIDKMLTDVEFVKNVLKILEDRDGE